MTAKLRVFVHLVFAAILCVTSGLAFAGDDFPGRKPDRRILETQEKVDSLFEKGDYERAGFIYREELARLGDKFAQYMLGYMCLTGKGRPSDIVAASAWYRLAAERGNEHFAKASNEIWLLLGKRQKVQSDVAYLELRITYSDAMIVANLIENDLEMLSGRFGDKSFNRFSPGGDFTSDRVRAARNEEQIKILRDRLDFLTDFFQSGQMYEKYELKRYEQLEQRASILISSYEDNN